MNRSELKSLSKSQLKGYWKVPILLTLIYGLVVLGLWLTQNFFIAQPVAFLFLLLTLVIEICATVGFPNFYLKFIKNREDTTLKDFFVSKTLLLKSLGYVLLMSLIGAIVGLIIGLILVSSMCYSMFAGDYLQPSWGIIVVILLIGVLLTIFCLSVAMTTFILVDKEGIGVFKAIGLSIKMMKGYKWKLFLLYLSFIGWALLCILTLGIGYLWLAPYIYLTLTNFYKELDKIYQLKE